MLTICAGLLAGAGVAAAAGRRPVAFTLLGAAGAAYLSPLRGRLQQALLAGISARGGVAQALLAGLQEMHRRAPYESVEFGSALYGSIRWRRLLL